MKSSQKRLIIYTRYPEPGTTKTRLIPAIGARAAADLQRRITEHTVAEARRFNQQFGIPFEIHFAGDDENRIQVWLGADVTCRQQVSGDLGQRLQRSFEATFAAGASEVVIVGCDIPDLTAEIMSQAFAGLATSDAVLGPALDGGYYLIGFREETFTSEAFSDIAWGTADVLAQTRQKLQAAERLVALLPALRDVDDVGDLCAITNHQR